MGSCGLHIQSLFLTCWEGNRQVQSNQLKSIPTEIGLLTALKML